jgi:hypothetical protein
MELPNPLQTKWGWLAKPSPKLFEVVLVTPILIFEDGSATPKAIEWFSHLFGQNGNGRFFFSFLYNFIFL